MISKEKKAEIIAQYGRKAGDTGSPEVQIAIQRELLNWPHIFSRIQRIITPEEDFWWWLDTEEDFLITWRRPIWKATVLWSKSLESESNYESVAGLLCGLSVCTWGTHRHLATFIHARVEVTPPYICMKTGAKGILRDRWCVPNCRFGIDQ